jgi:hypothetical protein
MRSGLKENEENTASRKEFPRSAGDKTKSELFLFLRILP